MVSDGETLTKEVSIHEDFELLNLEDQFSIDTDKFAERF